MPCLPRWSDNVSTPPVSQCVSSSMGTLQLPCAPGQCPLQLLCSIAKDVAPVLVCLRGSQDLAERQLAVLVLVVPAHTTSTYQPRCANLPISLPEKSSTCTLKPHHMCSSRSVLATNACATVVHVSSMYHRLYEAGALAEELLQLLRHHAALGVIRLAVTAMLVPAQCAHDMCKAWSRLAVTHAGAMTLSQQVV